MTCFKIIFILFGFVELKMEKYILDAVCKIRIRKIRCSNLEEVHCRFSSIFSVSHY